MELETKLGTKRRRRGFTLIELVVVIIILGILAAVIIPRVIGRTEDARKAKAKSDIESLSTALDMYRADNSRYPTTEQGLEALQSKPSSPPIPRAWSGKYLSKPLTPDPWGNPYIYKSPGATDPDGFDLLSLGADGQPGGAGNDEDISH